MTNEEIIEQLENAIELIKQDGKDWLDDRDIPILEACIKSLTALDKLRAEIAEYGSIMVSYAITKDTKTDKGIEKLVSGVLKQAKEQVLEMIDKYKAEKEVSDADSN